MSQAPWVKSHKLHYGLKRFLMYLLFALPACNIPFVFIGLMMGFPTALVTALFLSICDGVQADPNQPKPVFTHAMWLVLATEIAIVITYCIGFAMLS